MLGFFDGYRRDQVELLISVPSFAVTTMIILNAWLARLLRERMAIVTGLLLLTLGGIAPVFTSSYWLIFGSRILLGTGIGMINARAISIISERYQGQEKSALLGYRGSAEVLGNALMTLAAGQLLKIRWNAAFWRRIWTARAIRKSRRCSAAMSRASTTRSSGSSTSWKS